MDDHPLVSCITPTYNRSAMIKEAIKSNIAQTYQNWQMLIIDDQSTDDTWKVITDYANKEPRIRCFKNPEKGANNARNLGLAQAKGKYVIFLDDDDVNLPHRIESQVKAMQRSNSRFMLSWFQIRDRSNRFYKKTNKTLLTGVAAHFLVRWMIEKSLLEEVGGFNPDMMSMQEIELSYRLATRYNFDHHDDVVVTVYNTHNSISKGERGIKGKQKLLEDVGHLIPPEEQAAWYYAIALNYLRLNNLNKALHYYSLATGNSQYLKKHYGIFKFVTTLSVKTNSGLWGSRILARILKQKFSQKVLHRVISNS